MQEAHSNTAHANSGGEEVLAPDEAPTPMWLPLVGAALFLLAIIAFVATRSSTEPTGAAPAASADPVGTADHPAPVKAP